MKKTYTTAVLNECRMSVCTVKRENSDIHTVSDESQVVSSRKIDLAFKMK